MMKAITYLALPFALAGIAACESVTHDGALKAEPADAPVFDDARAPALPGTLFLQVEGSFEQADERLRRALDKRPLTVFAVIDHAANASGAGLSLPPTKLYVFGNPNGGTPFMAANAKMGLQLPMRMAIYERGGETHVAWPDIEALARSHGIEDGEAPVSGVRGNLQKIAEEVAFAPAGEN
jgi:uncharacterized protein (DUF302 family)